MLVKESRPTVEIGVREFAERYVRLPRTSPFGNVPFRCSRQPFSSLLFNEMDCGRWNTFLVSGPSQSGKTLSAFVIPTLRDVIALRLNTIIGFPAADMASDKWDTDFRPTFEASPRLEGLLPKSGPGSKGGRIRDRITLGNGIDLKIMTKGGDDTAKAGYTSPRVRVTEAAAWSQSSETSVEANPLRQLKARMKAFKRNDPRRCLFVEGTLTNEEELPWSARGDDADERMISSRSRILSPCPYCRAWIAPAREHLIGWQQAQSEDEAANEARWMCPECLGPIDNEQRKAAVAECRLVHYGQSVNEHGDVVGEPPPTSTLWFHWTGWDNLLRDIADFAVAEWEASQVEEGTEEAENAEKELCQFDFSVPYKSKLAEHEPLKAAHIRKKTDFWPRSTLPPDTIKLTIGCDLGDWTGWWFAIAWRECGQLYVPAYGAFDVKRNRDDDLSIRMQASIHDFIESVCEVGFPVEGDGGFWLPDAVWFDIGYRPDDVAAAIRTHGKFFNNRYQGCRGRGASVKNRAGGPGQQYLHPKRVSTAKPRSGNNWYMEPNYERKIPEITFNADYWKLYLDSRLRTEHGKKGSLSFYRADTKNEHAKVSNHLANEQFIKRWEPGKGVITEWSLKGDNHWKDAAAMACAAGDASGFRLIDCEEPEQERDVAEEVNFYAQLLGKA